MKEGRERGRESDRQSQTDRDKEIKRQTETEVDKEETEEGQ